MRGDEEVIRQGGCEAYISKPISVSHFLDTCRCVLNPPKNCPFPSRAMNVPSIPLYARVLLGEFVSTTVPNPRSAGSSVHVLIVAGAVLIRLA